MPRRANATRAHVRLAAQRHLACLALHLPTLPFEPQDPWPFLLQAEGLGVGEGGVCPEMCVGTGLRACDMQPYRACSPPPPQPLHCRRRLLCDVDPDPDPDLVRARPFWLCVQFAGIAVAPHFLFVKIRVCARACLRARVCDISQQPPSVVFCKSTWEKRSDRGFLFRRVSGVWC